MRQFLIFFLLLISALSYSQEQQVAYDYFRKGAFEKAATIYQSLYEKNNFNASYLTRLIYCHRQLEDFDKAQELIQNHLVKYPTQIQFYVEIGYNYELQHNQEKAVSYYNKAIAELEKNPNYGYAIGRSFQYNHLLEYALKAYKIALKANPRANYNIQLASIYGEKGEIENMFNAYLDLVEKDEKYSSTILRYINKYITEDSENKYNIIFKKTVLTRLQKNQLSAWNQMLSWMFIQQKQYHRAFIQEKALYKRNDSLGLGGVSNVGLIAFKHKDYSTTIHCFNFIVENSENSKDIIKSKLYLLYASMETSNDLDMVNTQFQDLFAEFGKNATTIDIQIAYADFLAFDMNESEKGIEILRETLNFRLDEFQKGEIKISLGDLLVFDGKFNEALVYFSQVQTRLKNHTLAQNARFKVAQTSYYKGDFEWAQTQLKVLKQSTSQRISNDAIELSLIISDNSVKDSLKLALKSYARADLLAFQNKNQQAVDTLTQLLRNHKGHAIEDEALFKQGETFEKMKLFDKASSNYIRLIEINDQDILVDNAYYRLAEISLKQNKLEKAKEYYQKIIFDYSSSIYMVDARKKFRTLRGDDLQ